MILALGSLTSHNYILQCWRFILDPYAEQWEKTVQLACIDIRAAVVILL